MGQGSQEEQLRLMQMVIEQQKSYIQMQEERIAEKDAAITDLRALVDELQSLKVNLEETLAMRDRVKAYNCEWIVCDCANCLTGVKMGGAKGIHLLELIFKTKEI